MINKITVVVLALTFLSVGAYIVSMRVKVGKLNTKIESQISEIERLKYSGVLCDERMVEMNAAVESSKIDTQRSKEQVEYLSAKLNETVVKVRTEVVYELIRDNSCESKLSLINNTYKELFYEHNNVTDD